MTILTVECDEPCHPVHAKSRIVILGNLRDTYWTKSDTYATVLSQMSLCLLLSLAIECRQVLKQGDCKNSFCHHPTIPPHEVIVVRLPMAVHFLPLVRSGASTKLFMAFVGAPIIGTPAFAMSSSP